MKLSSMKVTAVASPDAALLNSWNVHDTYFTRAILELETDDGHRGVAEVPGRTKEALEAARGAVLGRDPFDIEHSRRSIADVTAFGAVEVACLEIIGKAIDLRVVGRTGWPRSAARRRSRWPRTCA